MRARWRRTKPSRPWRPPKKYPWWKIECILDIVMELGRYSVRKVYERLRGKVSRYFVFWAEDIFERAGVVEIPRRREGRRKLLVDREEAVRLLRAYLEQTEGNDG